MLLRYVNPIYFVANTQPDIFSVCVHTFCLPSFFVFFMGYSTILPESEFS